MTGRHRVPTVTTTACRALNPWMSLSRRDRAGRQSTQDAGVIGEPEGRPEEGGRTGRHGNLAGGVGASLEKKLGHGVEQHAAQDPQEIECFHLFLGDDDASLVFEHDTHRQATLLQFHPRVPAHIGGRLGQRLPTGHCSPGLPTLPTLATMVNAPSGT